MTADAFGRRIDYLRISVTDRCNLRCTYCMPAEGVKLRPRSEILSNEQIVRIASAALAEGVSKLRVTGGEPLVRAGVAGLVGQLVELAGPEAVGLTTNGTLLPRFADELARAGLSRVNVSLDSLDAERYARITRGGRLDEAIAGIHAALATGFSPVKVNVVATSGVVAELDAFLKLAAENPVHVRFIERMPIGQSCSSASDETALTAEEVVALVAERAQALGLGAPTPATGAERPSGWGPARYYRMAGAQGTVGVIAPISRHFCASCNRLRLTADGCLRPCLFSDSEVSLLPALGHLGDEALTAALREAIALRPAGHALLPALEAARTTRTRSMHQIGG
jgi:cyclic pyranopterin phosphate synthase